MIVPEAIRLNTSLTIIYLPQVFNLLTIFALTVESVLAEYRAERNLEVFGDITWFVIKWFTVAEAEWTEW